MKLHPGPTTARLRQIKDDNMPHMCAVMRSAQVRGSGGMMRSGAPEKVADYNCHAALATEANEEIQQDALREGADWVVTLPLTANVVRGDTLEVTAPDWGRTLEVVGLAAPGATLARVVFCRPPLQHA